MSTRLVATGHTGRTGRTGRPRPRGRRVRFRDDLLGAVPGSVAALVITAALYAWFYDLARRGESNTVAVMPFMADPDAYRAYWLSQALGWSALLWSWATLVLGLLLAARAPRWIRRRHDRVEALHRRSNLTVVALVLAHALALLFDAHDTSVAEVLVPGAYDHPPGRFAVGLGIVALYLMVPLGLSYYVRDRIGRRTWRVLHRFVIVVYALGVWHTFLWGTNVWFTGWPRTALWAVQLPLAALVLHRLLAPVRRSDRVPPGRSLLRTRAGRARALRLIGRALAVTVVIALVIATFDGGGHPRT